MRNLLSLLFIILMVTLPSCEESSINEDNIDDVNLPKTKVRDVTDDTINGGSLPEVTVTAVYIAHEGSGGSGGGGGWWHPPFTEIPNPPSGSGGGGAGGTGRPNPPLPTAKLAKDLVTLFPNGSNLSKVDLEKLNSEFKRLMVRCEYEALNNLLKKNGFRGGKIQIKPADKRGLSSVDWTTGNYNFYGSAEIDAENLSHEWIHMCQNVLNKNVYEFEEIHGMAEFELVVFLDIIHYMKHGTFMRFEPLSDFPAAAQWISNLVVDDKEKDKIRSFYAIWIVTTCNEFKDGKTIRRIPKTIKDVSNYYIFADLFFKYSRNYQINKFVRNQEYGVKTLEALLQAVEENCSDKL